MLLVDEVLKTRGNHEINQGNRYRPNRPFAYLDAKREDDDMQSLPWFKRRHYFFGESGHLLPEIPRLTGNLNVHTDLPECAA